MYLENLVFDARDPRRLGRFWEAALGAQPLTDEADGYEIRLTVEGGPTLDLCFQPVPEPASQPPRLHLDLAGGSRQAEIVDRLIGLGAGRADIGQGSVSWEVLADPEENAFCVLDDRDADEGAGPIAAVPIDSAAPASDARFWARLSGWLVAPDDPTVLRHPSGRGLRLEFCPEPQPKPDVKNRLHLDLRLEATDDLDLITAWVLEQGGREWQPGWGDLPWRMFRDPSGNEFCLLPARVD